jgi:ubiquinone/menaquinone biosynthesis C-methylase UbiE
MGIHPVPEFFEHKIGLYWLWKAKRAPHWVERGVFSLLAIEPGSKTLELCCGDGFNAYDFYSARVGSLLSVDFDTQGHCVRRSKLPSGEHRLSTSRYQNANA